MAQELDTFDDGYTFDFDYPAPMDGLKPNKGTFRPLNYVQRERIQGEIEAAKSDPKKRSEIVCRTVAKQIKSWALTLKGSPLPISDLTCQTNVHAAHVDFMYLIAIGAVRASATVHPTEDKPLGDSLDDILGEDSSVEALQGN
jgi:hypothetical protein